MEDRRKDLPPEDDGEVVANMDVEGMPWSLPRHSEKAPGGTPMTKQEARVYTWAAVKAGLLIALVFGLAFLLFLLFADFVWLR